MRIYRSSISMLAALAALGLPAGVSHGATSCVSVPVFDSRCEAWTATFNGPATSGASVDDAFALAASPTSDRVFVTGTSRSDAGYDLATVAYDKDGAHLWTSRFDGTPGLDDGGLAIEVAPDGSHVYVAGYAHRGDASSTGDAVVVALDAATGSVVWSRSYDGPAEGSDAARDLVVAPDGERLYVTGIQDVVGSNSGGDFMTLALDTATGKIGALDAFDGPTGGTDEALSVAIAGSGDVFVGGWTRRSSTDTDFAIVGYDPDLERRWTTVRDGGLQLVDVAYALGVSPDGARVYATGHSRGPLNLRDVDYLTIALGSDTGQVLWSARYTGTGTADPISSQQVVDRNESSYDLVVGPDDSVYVAGSSSEVGTGRDLAVVSYRGSDGTRRWVSPFAAPNNTGEVGESLALDPTAATLYVTGYSQGTAVSGGFQGSGINERLPTNYLTIAMGTTDGAHRWVASFNSSVAGIDHSYGADVAVSHDGKRVYVGGAFIPRNPIANGDVNYGTVAYST